MAVRTGTTADYSTRWHVQTAAGLDAVVFIGALTGSSLQYEYYGREAGFVRSRLNGDATAALQRLTEFAELHGMLVGPNLALIFSAGPVDSLDDVIASARDPDARLRPGLQTSEYWDPREWTSVRDETLPDVLAVLLGLREAGFEAYWRRIAQPTLEMRVEATRKYLQRFDIIPEHERLLGRSLDPEIDVFLLYFSKPYGIRITGQRLASHHSYPMYIQLRTATHELFHPPFERGDHSVYERLDELRTDPWMQSILNNHDPSIGYNTFPELLDESATQALDQIVADRMGFDQGPGARWRTADGGMHMLAAAIYQMLRQDRFDETGGTFSEWFDSAIDRGLFAPAEVKRRAAQVVGQDAVDRWNRK
ncbi:MAG TPA: hypothetical protein VK854_16415 [Woeseiaceae bacterium]|nr:hypothetical protein [Woeseiaceae bacterium]